MIETLFQQRAHEKLERYRAEARRRFGVTSKRTAATSAGTGPRAG